MKIKHLSAVVILAALGLGGCANSDVYSGDVYGSSTAGRAQSVTYGTLVSVRPVKIQAGDQNPNVVGTVGGGVLGGIAGSAIGGGTGRSLATAAAMGSSSDGGAAAGIAVAVTGALAGEGEAARRCSCCRQRRISAASSSGGDASCADRVSSSSAMAACRRFNCSAGQLRVSSFNSLSSTFSRP